ncbi:PE family protein [Gordonia sp. DT30]|uniref:PE family protein n=1 Tax=unclassified Gordonia (in: high G+C Gram-positive bacteria) TaxID=2657482 RepID=UPI003CF6D47C
MTQPHPAPRNLDVDTDELARAAADLERLALSLEGTLARLVSATRVVASGRDEVSAAVATSATEGAARFGGDAYSGVSRLRNVAATLRAQAGGFDAADEHAATRLRD